MSRLQDSKLEEGVFVYFRLKKSSAILAQLPEILAQLSEILAQQSEILYTNSGFRKVLMQANEAIWHGKMGAGATWGDVPQTKWLPERGCTISGLCEGRM